MICCAVFCYFLSCVVFAHYHYSINSIKIIRKLLTHVAIFLFMCVYVCVCIHVSMYRQTKQALTIDPSHQLLQHVHLHLDTRLGKRIVVLYAVQEPGEAPETISLHLVHYFCRQAFYLEVSVFSA